MADKDDYRVQRVRIERIAKELVPNCLVEFSPGTTPDWIKFRISDEKTGTILAVSSGDWRSSEIADKSDQWLRAFIQQLGAGRI
jgi:phage gpG-like protein